MSKKLIFTFAILTVLVAILAYFGLSDKFASHNTIDVVLHDYGFEPKVVTIHKGDIVRFSTNTNRLYWPASDIHPTHELYPTFDPQDPIQTTDSWSFRFQNAGRWKYHDHLSPYFTGEIIVQ